MRKPLWRIVQAVLGIVVLFFIGREVAGNWDKVRATSVEWRLVPALIVASLLVTWAMYAVLIWGWRTVLQGWRQRLSGIDAARIWTISSLGKYIPGKVWAIAGMVMMAEREGVSATAATAPPSSCSWSRLHAAPCSRWHSSPTDLLDQVRGGSVGAMLLAAGAFSCALGLTLPSVTGRLGRLVGRPDALQPVHPAALAGAIAANFVAWAGYGLALQLLIRGTMPTVHLGWMNATGAFAASYISGYLFLLLPGGLGIREGVMVLLLKGTIGEGPAVGLAAASRIVLTINEIGAALPFLLLRRRGQVRPETFPSR